MPHDLFLGPTVIAGDKLPDDYSVIIDGRSIGRIRLATERLGHNPGWDWMLNPPLPIPTWGTGSADTLEDAKAAFREAWSKFYEGLTPTDIEQWHHVQDAQERSPMTWSPMPWLSLGLRGPSGAAPIDPNSFKRPDAVDHDSPRTSPNLLTDRYFSVDDQRSFGEALKIAASRLSEKVAVRDRAVRLKPNFVGHGLLHII